MPTHFAVYGKEAGPGLVLAMNSTAANLDGLGVKHPLGDAVTIRGLIPNQGYMLGVAAFDAEGHLCGELGEPGPTLIPCLPLPLLSLHAHVVSVSGLLALPKSIGLDSFELLWGHFVTRAAPRPIWEANPFDEETFKLDALRVASPALVHGLVHAVLTYVSRLTPVWVDFPTAAGRAELQGSYIEDQMTRLRAVKRLVLGMYASAAIGEEPLLAECAVRAHVLLQPFTTKAHPPCAPVAKALAAVAVLLARVRDHDLDACRAVRPASAYLYASAVRAVEAVGSPLQDLAETGVLRLLGKLDADVLRATVAAGDVEGRGLVEMFVEDPQLRALAGPLVQEKLNPTPSDPAAAAAAVKASAPGGNMGAAAIPPPDADLFLWALARIRSDHVRDTWALLTDEAGPSGIAKHPRVLELMSRCVLEAYRRGEDALVEPWSAVIHAKRIQWISFYGLEPTGWRLADAVTQSTITELTPEQLVEYGLVPAPQAEVDDGAKDGENTSEATSSDPDPERVAAVLYRLQAQDAAVRFLQSRWKALARVCRIRHERRVAHRGVLKWVARVEAVAGLVLAARCATTREDKDDEQDQDDGGTAEDKKDDVDVDENEDEDDLDALRPGSAGGALAEGQPLLVPRVKTVDEKRCMNALRRMARAVELAARAQCHATLYRIWLDLFDAFKMLLSVHREHLLGPEARAQPDVLVFADAAGKKKFLDAWTARRLDVPGAPPPRTTVGPLPVKGGEDEEPGAENPATVPAWSETLSGPVGVDNLARILFNPMLRLLELVAAVGRGMPLADGAPIPPLDANASVVPSSVAGSEVGGAMDASLYESGVLNLDWIKTTVMSMMHFFLKKARPAMMFTVGETFYELTGDVYADKVMPLLVRACPLVGRDIQPFQNGLDRAIRDKSAGLMDLEQLRERVQKRFGVLAPEQLVGVGKQVRKRSRRLVPGTGVGGAGGISQWGSAGPQTTVHRVEGSDGRSVVSSRFDQQTGIRHVEPAEVRYPREYGTVIEKLRAKGERRLVVLANNELGDLYAHLGQLDLAVSAWSDALDMLLGPYHCLTSWEGALGKLTATELLARYSVQILLLGIKIAGKLCRLASVKGGGADTQRSAARLACTLSGAIFSCSITHPQRPMDFGDYRPTNLWERASLFGDPYALNVPDLLGACESLGAAALDHGLAVEAGPLLCLAEYVAHHVARDVRYTLAIRIQRIRACVAAQLPGPAARLVRDVLNASSLPSRSRGGMHLPLNLPVEEDPVPVETVRERMPEVGVDLPSYDMSALPTDPEKNKKWLDLVATTELHPLARAVLGEHNVSLLALARAEFLRMASRLARMGPALMGTSTDGRGASLTTAYVATHAHGAAVLLGQAATWTTGVITPWLDASSGTEPISRPTSPIRPRVVSDADGDVDVKPKGKKGGKRPPSGGKDAKRPPSGGKGKKGGAADLPEVVSPECRTGANPVAACTRRDAALVAGAYLLLAQIREDEARFQKALDYVHEAGRWCALQPTRPLVYRPPAAADEATTTTKATNASGSRPTTPGKPPVAPKPGSRPVTPQGDQTSGAEKRHPLSDRLDDELAAERAKLPLTCWLDVHLARVRLATTLGLPDTPALAEEATRHTQRAQDTWRGRAVRIWAARYQRRNPWSSSNVVRIDHAGIDELRRVSALPRPLSSFISDEENARVEIEAGDALDALGAQLDAGALWLSAAQTMKKLTDAWGLPWMLEKGVDLVEVTNTETGKGTNAATYSTAAETGNATLFGANTYAESLLRLSTVLLRGGDATGAAQAAVEVQRVAKLVHMRPELRMRAHLLAGQAGTALATETKADAQLRAKSRAAHPNPRGDELVRATREVLPRVFVDQGVVLGTAVDPADPDSDPEGDARRAAEAKAAAEAAEAAAGAGAGGKKKDDKKKAPAKKDDKKKAPAKKDDKKKPAKDDKKGKGGKDDKKGGGAGGSAIPVIDVLALEPNVELGGLDPIWDVVAEELTVATAPEDVEEGVTPTPPVPVYGLQATALAPTLGATTPTERTARWALRQLQSVIYLAFGPLGDGFVGEALALGAAREAAYLHAKRGDAPRAVHALRVASQIEAWLFALGARSGRTPGRDVVTTAPRWARELVQGRQGGFLEGGTGLADPAVELTPGALSREVEPEPLLGGLAQVLAAMSKEGTLGLVHSGEMVARVAELHRVLVGGSASYLAQRPFGAWAGDGNWREVAQQAAEAAAAVEVGTVAPKAPTTRVLGLGVGPGPCLNPMYASPLLVGREGEGREDAAAEGVVPPVCVVGWIPREWSPEHPASVGQMLRGERPLVSREEAQAAAGPILPGPVVAREAYYTLVVASASPPPDMGEKKEGAGEEGGGKSPIKEEEPPRLVVRTMRGGEVAAVRQSVAAVQRLAMDMALEPEAVKEARPAAEGLALETLLNDVLRGAFRQVHSILYPASEGPKAGVSKGFTMKKLSKLVVMGNKMRNKEEEEEDGLRALLTGGQPVGKVDRLKTIVATMTADLGLPSAEVIGNPRAEVKDEVLKRVFSEEGKLAELVAVMDVRTLSRVADHDLAPWLSVVCGA